MPITHPNFLAIISKELFSVANKHSKGPIEFFVPYTSKSNSSVQDKQFPILSWMKWNHLIFQVFLLWLSYLPPILKWFRYHTYLTVQSYAKGCHYWRTFSVFYELKFIIKSKIRFTKNFFYSKQWAMLVAKVLSISNSKVQQLYGIKKELISWNWQLAVLFQAVSNC